MKKESAKYIYKINLENQLLRMSDAMKLKSQGAFTDAQFMQAIQEIAQWYQLYKNNKEFRELIKSNYRTGKIYTVYSDINDFLEGQRKIADALKALDSK